MSARFESGLFFSFLVSVSKSLATRETEERERDPEPTKSVRDNRFLNLGRERYLKTKYDKKSNKQIF
ncbi:MAG: hypothetical protein Q8R20_00800 [Nanoarchaeota archaeon]|nr:hypothetical protein [Nanoarchaeota archaeon]